MAAEVGDETRARAVLTHDPTAAERLTLADHRKLPDAAREQQADAVRLMLSLGWPIDTRGQHGGTALHWACWNGMPDLVRDLLAHQPSLEICDFDFKVTPLDWAIYASVHGWPCSPGNYPAVVEALLDAGANPPASLAGLEMSDDVREVLRRRGNTD